MSRSENDVRPGKSRRRVALALIVALLSVGVWLATSGRTPSNPTRPGESPSVRSLLSPSDAALAVQALGDRDDTNLLFILVDTLRSDRLSAYGYKRITSPTIDSLAGEGIRFGRHTAQSSWTKCSMASLWTGLYPNRTGVVRYSHAVSDEADMPAELLGKAGFRTAAIWRNGWVAPNFGFAQGFDVYHRPRPGQVPPSVRSENPSIKLEGTDEDIILSSLEFLRTNRNERWFLYLHLMDVHQYVHDEDTAIFGTRYSDLYDNAIRWDDRLLGFLMRELDTLGLRERTIIALVSDHGEAFAEHGLEGHAHNVYAEVTTTPFVLSLPFDIESGVVVAQPTENVDVWPTLLDMLQLPPLSDPDGRSRMPEIMAALGKPEAGIGNEMREEVDTSEERHFAHLDQTWGRTQDEPSPVIAVSDGRFRLIHHSKRPDQQELYDHNLDPDEQHNIFEASPTVAARLMKDVDDYLTKSTAPWGGDAPVVDLDEMQLNQLRALGYQID